MLHNGSGFKIFLMFNRNRFSYVSNLFLEFAVKFQKFISLNTMLSRYRKNIVVPPDSLVFLVKFTQVKSFNVRKFKKKLVFFYRIEVFHSSMKSRVYFCMTFIFFVSQEEIEY